MELYKQTAKIILRDIRDRMERGEIPRFLGAEGMVALIYDSISRFKTWGDGDELLRVASMALIALAMQVEPALEEEAEEIASREKAEQALYFTCPKCGKYDKKHPRYMAEEVELCITCGSVITWEEYVAWTEKLRNSKSFTDGTEIPPPTSTST